MEKKKIKLFCIEMKVKESEAATLVHQHQRKMYKHWGRKKKLEKNTNTLKMYQVTWEVVKRTLYMDEKESLKVDEVFHFVVTLLIRPRVTAQVKVCVQPLFLLCDQMY